MVAILGVKLVHGLPESFAITIVSSNDAFLAGPGLQKTGSPLFLLVTLTNNSTRTVSVPSFDGDSYTIDVRDEHGKSLPETDGAHRIKAAKAPNARIVRSGVTGELKPREALRRTIDLSQYVDIGHSGKYTIQLTRKLPEELGPGVVKSNTISVTLTP
jgi:hypothetical protein